MKPMGRQVRGGLLHSSLGGTERRSGPFPVFNAVTVEFITLKPVELFAGARMAAAALAMQNAAGGKQPSLPGMDAAPSAALTIKAYLSQAGEGCLNCHFN